MADLNTRLKTAVTIRRLPSAGFERHSAWVGRQRLKHPPASAGGIDTPQQNVGNGKDITDRMLATVNGQLITESDVLWALALDPELQPLDLSLENRKAMLEQLIDQKMLDLEAEKIPQNEPSDEEISAYINNELIKRFGSETAFRERLQKVGLEQVALREIARHRVEILKYVEFRFRSFVLVKPEEIERYYRDLALPRMRNRGGNVRPLEEMRAEIEKTLADEKVNAELDRFFDETRQQAQVVRLARW